METELVWVTKGKLILNRTHSLNFDSGPIAAVPVIAKLS